MLINVAVPSGTLGVELQFEPSVYLLLHAPVQVPSIECEDTTPSAVLASKTISESRVTGGSLRPAFGGSNFRPTHDASLKYLRQRFETVWQQSMTFRARFCHIHTALRPQAMRPDRIYLRIGCAALYFRRRGRLATSRADKA